MESNFIGGEYELGTLVKDLDNKIITTFKFQKHYIEDQPT